MRDTIIDTITVTEASQIEGRDGSEQWEIRMDVPSIGSQYPTGPCFMPLANAASIKKGQQVRVKLTRGNAKKGKEGSDREWDYWWEIAQWGTDEAAPAPSSGGYSGGQGERGNQIAWNSAVNNAVYLHGPLPYQQILDGTFQYSYGAIALMAGDLYSLITQGPPGSHQEPAETVTEPEPSQKPAPRPNPTKQVADAIAIWNKDNPDNKITQDYIVNAVYRLYGKGEPTAKEALAALSPEEGLELAGLVAKGELAMRLANKAVDTQEQGEDLDLAF